MLVGWLHVINVARRFDGLLVVFSCLQGFKAIAQRLCVGHAHAYPVEWGVEVEVWA